MTSYDLPRRAIVEDAGTLETHALRFNQAMATSAEKQAFKLIDQNDIAGAQECLKSAFILRVKAARSYLNLARNLLSQGNDRDATRFLDEALKLSIKALRTDESYISTKYVINSREDSTLKPVVISDARDLSAVHLRALLKDAVNVDKEYNDLIETRDVTLDDQKDEGRLNDPIKELYARVWNRPEKAAACLRFLDREEMRARNRRSSPESSVPDSAVLFGAPVPLTLQTRRHKQAEFSLEALRDREEFEKAQSLVNARNYRKRKGADFSAEEDEIFNRAKRFIRQAKPHMNVERPSVSKRDAFKRKGFNKG